MRSRSIEVEKIREITKSAVFVSFSAPTWLFFINLKDGFFSLNMAWKDVSFNAHFDVF